MPPRQARGGKRSSRRLQSGAVLTNYSGGIRLQADLYAYLAQQPWAQQACCVLACAPLMARSPPDPHLPHCSLVFSTAVNLSCQANPKVSG